MGTKVNKTQAGFQVKPSTNKATGQKAAKIDFTGGNVSQGQANALQKQQNLQNKNPGATVTVSGNTVTMTKTNAKGKKVTTSVTYKDNGAVKKESKTTETKKKKTTTTTKYGEGKATTVTSKSTTLSGKNKGNTTETVKERDKDGKLVKKTTTKVNKKTGKTTTETVNYTQNSKGKTVRTDATTTVTKGKGDKAEKVSEKVVKYDKETGLRKSRTTTTKTADGKEKVVKDKFDNDKISSRTVKVDGKKVSTTDWTYKDGKLDTKVEKDLTTGTETKKEYSDYETVKEKVKVKKDGKEVEVEVEKTVRKVKITTTDKDGNATERVAQQKLNEKGKLEQVTYMGKDGTTPVRTRNFTYDENNRLDGITDTRTYKDGTTKTVTMSKTADDGITQTFKRTITFTSADGTETKTFTDTATKDADGKFTRVRSGKNTGATWIQNMINGAGTMIEEITNYLKKFGNLSEDEEAELAKLTGETALGEPPLPETPPTTTLPTKSSTVVTYPSTMTISTETKEETFSGGVAKEVNVSVLENPGTEAVTVDVGGQSVSVPAGGSITIHDDGTGIMRYEAKEGSTIGVTIYQTDNETNETKSAEVTVEAGILAHPSFANYPKYSGRAVGFENPTDKELTVIAGDKEIKLKPGEYVSLSLDGATGAINDPVYQ